MGKTIGILHFGKHRWEEDEFDDKSKKETKNDKPKKKAIKIKTKIKKRYVGGNILTGSYFRKVW